MSASNVQSPPERSRAARRGFVPWAIWLACAALVLAGGTWLAFRLAGQTAPPVFGFEVVQTYPHDPAAFTQGLVFSDGQLYEGTGLYGESTLRLVDLKTGQVLRRHPLDSRTFGEGIAIVGDEIVQLTWKRELALVYDRATFRHLRSFPYHGEGWGLTYDGTHLIMSDGTARLRFLDPKTFRVVKRLRITEGRREISQLNELEWVEGEIYANVWYRDRIARISPKTGEVLGWIDLTGLIDRRQMANPQEAVLNGIAYDAKDKRLFVTGKNWPHLFEIKVTKPK